jgi:DnaJ-related protein SCJ1
MSDGHKITFEQEADENPDVTPGDVIFKIVTLPHKRFVRVGDDLHMKLNISLLEALVGFSKIFKHLDGHEVKITKDTVSKPGEIMVINDEGMPHHNYSSQMGKLYVELNIKMPNSITEAQKQGTFSIFIKTNNILAFKELLKDAE